MPALFDIDPEMFGDALADLVDRHVKRSVARELGPLRERIVQLEAALVRKGIKPHVRAKLSEVA